MRTSSILLSALAISALSLVACEDDKKTTGRTDSGSNNGTTDSGSGDSTASDSNSSVTTTPCTITARAGADASQMPPGRMTDEWGTSWTITGDTITTGSEDWGYTIYIVDVIDATTLTVIAQTACDSTYNPGDWAVFEFEMEGGDLYTCQSTYNAKSAEEAATAERANKADLLVAGCNGSPWTNMGPPNSAEAGAGTDSSSAVDSGNTDSGNPVDSGDAG